MRIITHCTLLTMFMTYSACAGETPAGLYPEIPKPSAPAASSMPESEPGAAVSQSLSCAGAELSSEDEKLFAAAAKELLEKESKLRAAHFSTMSMYPAGLHFFSKFEADPAITITREKSWHISKPATLSLVSHMRHVAPDSAVDLARSKPGDKYQLRGGSITRKRLTLMAMSNGQYAIGSDTSNDLDIHYRGSMSTPTKRKGYINAWTFGRQQGKHYSTSLLSHEPDQYTLCTVNPSITRVMTVRNDLTGLAVHSIAYAQNESPLDDSRVDISIPTEPALVPLYFCSDYECIALGIQGKKVYCIDAQDPSNIAIEVRHDIPAQGAIKQVSLSWHNFGLKAKITIARALARDIVYSLDSASDKPVLVFGKSAPEGKSSKS